MALAQQNAPSRTPSGQRSSIAETPAAGHSVLIDQITHRFGAVTAVQDVRLDLEPGELVALLGPSGCGKTTLLRIIAGFIAPTAGQIWIGGKPTSARLR
jgi:putative spermidine/putrescine transport system ATP-binding protein